LTAGGARPNLRAVRSIVLAVLSLLCIGAGVMTTPVPVVGTVFSFGAPTLALLGVILGGVDISSRRRAGQSSDAALAGVILSALCFLPALATSLTCGVCNALFSSAPIDVRRDIRFDVRNNPQPQVRFADGGTSAFGGTAPALRGGAPLAPPPFAPSFGRADGGVAQPAQPGQPTEAQPRPAPVIPPPPLPPGPRPR
jgi:hypothetical protein